MTGHMVVSWLRHGSSGKCPACAAFQARAVRARVLADDSDEEADSEDDEDDEEEQQAVEALHVRVQLCHSPPSHAPPLLHLLDGVEHNLFHIALGRLQCQRLLYNTLFLLSLQDASDDDTEVSSESESDSYSEASAEVCQRRLHLSGCV